MKRDLFGSLIHDVDVRKTSMGMWLFRISLSGMSKQQVKPIFVYIWKSFVYIYGTAFFDKVSNKSRGICLEVGYMM